MSIANYIPELWSARLLANLDKNLVLGNAPIINRDWEGEIKNVGDTVHIQRPGAIAVNAYNPASTTVSYETPTSTTRALVIDQDQYFAFQVDDLAQVQANVELVDRYTQRAAYALADKIDQFIAALYTDSSAGDVPLTLASGDYYEALVQAGQNLDEKNVPRAGRWHVTNPAGYAALLKHDAFIHATASGDSVLRTGQVGSVAGFTIYVSNNLVTVDGEGGDPDTVKGLYGTDAAITFAQQLLGSPEAIRLEGKIADAVRGRVAYGAKVVEPNALGTITLT